jgi:hypothetical protein
MLAGLENCAIEPLTYQNVLILQATSMESITEKVRTFMFSVFRTCKTQSQDICAAI